MDALLTDENFLALVVAIIGAVWTFVRGTEVYQSKMNARRELVLTLVGAAVERVYQGYVRGIKAEGRKLTDSERETAKASAMIRARELADMHKVDSPIVANDLLLEEAIERAVREAKIQRAAGKVIPVEPVHEPGR